MALKTLQRKYDELLKVFESVGVKLDESQKNSLDTFMVDFQNKLTETRDNAIKATKKIVEERLEKEYKTVFESIIGHQKEIFEKSGKIDVARSQSIMSEAIDQYLSEHVKEALPKKSIVDYKRMRRLEQIQESMKDMLLVNDDAVEKKVEQMKAELELNAVSERQELKSELEKCKSQLAESRKLGNMYSEKCKEYAKKELIEQKTKNLPIVESKEMRKRLSKMTVEEIDTNYKTILEAVQAEVAAEQDSIQEEKNLEEAIQDILSEKDKNSQVAPEKTGDEGDKGTENNTEGGDNGSDSETTPPEEEDGGVQVTESMMQSWIDTLARITPRN